MKKNRSLSASRCYLVLIGSLLLLSCSKPPQQAPAMLPAVKVTEVIQDDVAVFEEWVGTLDGMVNATINAQVTGYLIKQNYKEGDLVKKDQLLYEIDPRTFQAALAQAKANLAQQQAVLKTNQLALDRIKRLLPEKAVSVLDRDNAVGAVATANAQVLAAQAAVDTAQLNLGFTKITSPISGIAGVSKTQLGDLVGPGSANNELTTVSQVDPIRVYIGLSESQYLHFVEQKQNSHQESGTVPLELKLADNSVYPHSGKFFFAGRAVDVSTGTIKIAGLFPNTNNVLRPGMYARIRANVSKETGLLVPQQAMMQLQTATQLAVVNKEDKVEMRTVKLGSTSGKLVVVKDGVKLGERVIVEGGQKVRNGMKVQPAPYTATAKAE